MIHSSFSKYLNLVLWACFSILFGVATTNYIVDPANIYPNLNTPDILETLARRKLVKQMVNSDYGIQIKTGDFWLGSEITHELARNLPPVQCVVTGSSHINNIRSTGKDRSLLGICDSLIILWQTGTTLGDTLAILGSILKSRNRPKTILLGMDPWNLSKPLYLSENEYKFLNMRAKLTNKQYTDIPGNSWELLSNLISYNYFLRSIKKRSWSIQLAPKFDQDVGLDYSVALPDGGLVRSALYNRKSNAENKNLSGIIDHTYGTIEGIYISSEAKVELLTLLIKYLKQQKFQVILLLTPWHPAIWNHPEQPLTISLKMIESKFHEIAKTTGVQIIGSYNPQKIGCAADDFWDYDHAKPGCLKKLQ